MIRKIVCIGGVMDGYSMECRDNNRPEERILMSDPKPTPYRHLFDGPLSPVIAFAPKKQFYELERLTSQSGEIHLFYRHNELTNDEALTLLLTRYEKISEITRKGDEDDERRRRRVF